MSVADLLGEDDHDGIACTQANTLARIPLP